VSSFVIMAIVKRSTNMSCGDHEMTSEEFRTIRENLGLSTERFGRALGYQGSYGTAARHIRRFESGARSIPQTICRLVEMFGRHGVPDSWTQ
jgi:DNA-binding transcriptional regulator YiaG